jgi:glycosyltransferase involved in cell wall biosynthesis
MQSVMKVSRKIKRKLNKILRAITRRFNNRSFDPIFYYSHYKDLSELKSARRLKRHFKNHGFREGRFPNEFLYIEHKKRELLLSPGRFDLIAYKFFNHDLLGHFDKDEEFVEHYVRHGIHEGRRCYFSDGEGFLDDVIDPRKKWKNIFSTSEMIAWSSGLSSSKAPTSRDEALALFLKEGVDALWPISFDHRFDPEFYRQAYGDRSSRGKGDAELYREWLEEGVPAGRAPNEELYLYSFMGGAPYPASFDWRGYAAHARLGKRADRRTVLTHLFREGSADIQSCMRFFGKDAYDLLGYIGRHLLITGRFNDAVLTFETALALRKSADLYLLLGDAQSALGKQGQALGSFLASIAYQSTQIWPYLHAINIYCAQGDFEAAFDLLRRSFERWRHRPEYEQTLESCIDRYFEYQSARAHERLRIGTARAEAADAGREAYDLLWQTLDDIQRIYMDLDLLPANTGGSADGYVLMLANDDLRQCTHYRVEQKRYQFAEAGIPIKIISHHNIQEFVDNLVGAKAVICYRLAATPRVLRAILQARRMGLPTYYEIDDLIFDAAHYPDSYESYEGQISPDEYAGLRFGVPLFRYAMSMCDAGISSTHSLAKKIREVTQTTNCVVVPNGLDERNASAIRMGSLARPADGKIRIFYGSGTKAHNSDFNDIVSPALIEIMKRDERVELVIVGYLFFREEFKPFQDRVRNYPFVSDLDAYWSLLATCHINLAVLHPSLMADCKSEIKWLEAAVLRIPSIVSDTATYREVIDDGVDGFIASTTEDWRDRLMVLIDSAPLRLEVGGRARSKALEDYDVTKAAKIWQNIFGGRHWTSSANRKSRVLICNVFFYPQSIGGATRVVEDNVSALLDNFDDFELAVCCSDEGKGAAARMRMTSFRGVPVYRIATPLERDMDWRPFNPENGTIFERVLDHFKPDLVHFHCVQRLTASIVEATLQRGIKYVVTLHDGWWISDNQFLVDEDGFLRLPSRDVLNDCKDRKSVLASIARRQRLGGLLKAASARLSVSEPFAGIYEAAGITDIGVIENGVSVLPRMEKRRRADGRVNLGHIGGRASHKGAFLIEAVLRQEKYCNLHLTMIDGTLGPEQTIETMWGATPVTLTGPYPQARVSDLYAEIDVLLAPSTWPESFGLVTREAMFQDCWVVASNLGALAQGIKEDVNGHIVNIGDSRDLNHILGKIDRDPERYRKSPKSKTERLRPAVEQARELHAVYKELLGGDGGHDEDEDCW